ncbi:chemotaxis protein CheW [Wenzhouxiangella sp. XN24]|uniref:chemotaxis protein CheW n=1 Tax=Wenzhouxiangella sp. XN24 TaxID=2713569 RepID=UPI0013EA443D|nr:chemotaxis protein CheW [Wenzhouxiangella sp. XN24]NGX15007.1 chemotaxis protein CheW [Wenzhouxiangella sp. XN24]
MEKNVSRPSTPGAEDAREYLTFRLGTEEYGLNILNAQEIRGYDSVTKIANSPAFIKGVINMRGIIVPIIDMRIRFNLGEATYNEFTVVIILNIGERVIGMVVDAVSDVTSAPDEQVHPAPEFGTVLDTAYIDGIATVDERMIIIIDIEKLMTAEDMGLMDQAAA